LSWLISQLTHQFAPFFRTQFLVLIESPCHEQTRASNDDGQFSAWVGQSQQSYPDRIRFAKVVKVGFGVSWPLVHVHASFEMPL